MTVALALTLQDFGVAAQQSYRAQLAATVGADVSSVSLSITAGSVTVVAIVTTSSLSVAQVAATTVAAAMAAESKDATFLGFPLAAIPQAPITEAVLLPAPSPPPPTTPAVVPPLLQAPPSALLPSLPTPPPPNRMDDLDAPATSLFGLGAPLAFGLLGGAAVILAAVALWCRRRSTGRRDERTVIAKRRRETSTAPPTGRISVDLAERSACLEVEEVNVSVAVDPCGSLRLSSSAPMVLARSLSPDRLPVTGDLRAGKAASLPDLDNEMLDPHSEESASIMQRATEAKHRGAMLCGQSERRRSSIDFGV